MAIFIAASAGCGLAPGLPFLIAARLVQGAAAAIMLPSSHSPLGHNGKPLDDETITRIAASRGKYSAQVILRWHLQHGHIVIPKSARRERMEDNLNVIGFELSEAEIKSIDALDQGESGRAGPNPDTYEGL